MEENKQNKRNKGKGKASRRRQKRKTGTSIINASMGKNYPGAPIYRHRLRLGTINVTSTGGGAVSLTSTISRSMLTTDGAAIIDAFQKYRMWKCECHIYGCTTGSGLARAYTYDYDMSSSPASNTVFKVVSTNTASQRSYQVVSYTATDYPDLEFKNNGEATNFCKLGMDSIGNSLFATSTLVYVVEVYGHFETKMYGA